MPPIQEENQEPDFRRVRFDILLAEITAECGFEGLPVDKVSELATLCGPAEIAILIARLDRLDNADLIDDAGDVGDEYWRLRMAYSQALGEVGQLAVEPLLKALASP